MRLALNRDALGTVMLVNRQVVVEHIVDFSQDNLVLRALGAGQRWHHGRHVERQRVGENRVRHVRIGPQTLLLGIGLNQRNLVLVTAGQPQIIERLFINAKEATGRTIFGRHIGERRAVGKRQRRQTRPVIFDKTPDHALGAQHLRCGQHQVGRGHTLGQARRSA